MRLTPRLGRGPRAAALAVAVMACALLVLVHAPPGAARQGACPDVDGVTVVVDFRSLGGETIVACASGAVSSGFDALHRAGISYQTITSQPGFICRISGLPADQSCAETPPANAYWSYWHAERGGDWAYARVGAASRTPPPGSVDGWSFSTDPTTPESAPPRTPPPPPATQQPEPAPTPTPSAAPPTPPQPAPAPSAATRPGTTQDPGTAEQSDATATGPAIATATPTSSAESSSADEPLDEQAAPPAPPASPPPTGPATDDPKAAEIATEDATTPAQSPGPDPLATAVAAATSDPRPAPTQDRTAPPVRVGGATADGPPWPTLVGAGLVLGVGGAAGAVALRRRPR